MKGQEERAMGGRVEGKVALVTGGGTGIGRATAETLAREGAAIVVANRSAETGEETVRRIAAAGGRAVFSRTDVASDADCVRAVQAAVERFGKLDVLVNNAGIFPRYTLEQTTPEVLEEILAIDFKGAFYLCKHAIPEMVKAGGGSIINVGSIHGVVGAPNLVAYASAKGALLNLTKTLARAYARQQVRVNYLIPGWVITEGEIRTQAKEGHSEEWLHETGKRLPMGRLQQPQDAADAALFLASDESSQITAAVINTDGGSSVFWG
jgi:NAD(P)-dependent dehydrogenase (short-subunit alcohol dehydrogenase family)